MKIQIYYEDTDCGGVVYYANYLKYFERSRTEYFKERGICVKDLKDKGIQFVVVRAEVDYKSPAVYGDTIEIDTTVDDKQAASFNISYVVKEASSGRTIALGKTRMACVDQRLKPVRLPVEVVEKL